MPSLLQIFIGKVYFLSIILIFFLYSFNNFILKIFLFNHYEISYSQLGFRHTCFEHLSLHQYQLLSNNLQISTSQTNLPIVGALYICVCVYKYIYITHINIYVEVLHCLYICGSLFVSIVFEYLLFQHYVSLYFILERDYSV